MDNNQLVGPGPYYSITYQLSMQWLDDRDPFRLFLTPAVFRFQLLATFSGQARILM